MPSENGVPVEEIISIADQLFERTSPDMLRELASPSLQASIDSKK
jgi:hypothetical protein